MIMYRRAVEMRIEREIRKILNDTLSAEVITYYPTDEDKARNSHLKPGAENEVVGIDEAVKEIMKIIGREIQNQNVMG